MPEIKTTIKKYKDWKEPPSDDCVIIAPNHTVADIKRFLESENILDEIITLHEMENSDEE